MKTLKDLIEELNCLVKSDPELLEAPIYVFADHGQTFIQAGCVSLEYTDEGYEYMMDFTCDLEDVEDMSRVKTFICIGD